LFAESVAADHAQTAVTSVVQDTPAADVVAAIKRVAGNKQQWLAVSAADKLAHLYEIRAQTLPLIDEWAAACAESRGLSGTQAAFGYVIGAGLFGFHLGGWIASYEALVATGEPAKPSKVRQVGADVLAAQVAPYGALETVAMAGERIELWLEPGQPATQGKFKSATAGVCGVLGAGNFEAPSDVLSKLFGDQHVVVYKTHPNLHKSTAPFFRRIFKKLIDAGFFAVIEGNTAPGAALVADRDVDELLMTGGQLSYDAMVWGRDAAAAKAANKPLVTKPFDAELGAVSPWIVVPGQWTDAELKHHAEFLVACKMTNAAAVCASPQAVVVDGAWPQLAQFKQQVLDAARKCPAVPVFYGGSCQRATQIADASAAAGAQVTWADGQRAAADRDETGARTPAHLAIIDGVKAGGALLTTEAFAPVLGYVAIDGTGGDAKAFLTKAVAFANKEAFGTLSCSLMIDPRTEAAIGSATLDEAIKALRYGTVGVNQWGGNGAFRSAAVWGAAPGAHTPRDIQSGIGFIGNSRFFDHPAKQVIFSPFVNPGHTKAPSANDAKLYPRVTYFAVEPGVVRLLGVLSAALVGF
jgi:acyl-CoA reductase-like NAD-dependent aldehyde dehydrogenase